jgi:hypothetical protein
MTSWVSRRIYLPAASIEGRTTANTKQTPSIPGLVIQPNDRLYLVQAYDDGWCLCQNLAHQRGFVPLYCLQPATTQNNNTSSSSQPTLALHPPSPTMQDGGPTSPISPALMSPGVVGEGQKETLRFLQPVMVVNGQNQQGSGGSMSVQSPSGNALPR